MARIIPYNQQVAPDARGAIIPRASAPEGLGQLARQTEESTYRLSRGLETVGDAMMRGQRLQEEETAKAWSASALSEAKLYWTTEFINRQSTAGPEAADFTPNMLRDYDEYSQKLMGNAPSGLAQRFLSERLGEYKNGLAEKSLTFEAQARIDYRSDQYSRAIDNTKKLMNTDPSQFKTAMAEQLAVIDSANMPPVKKSALRDKAIAEVSQAAVWSQIQRGPTAFLQSIGFLGATGPDGKVRPSSGDITGKTGNDAFDAMPFDQRVKMFDLAVRQQAQLDSDLDRRSKEANAKLADNAGQNAWKMIYDKNLKGALNYVEQIRPLITDTTYHSLRSGIHSMEKEMKEGKGAAAKTDPTAFRELMRLRADGKYEEAAAQAFTYHRNGRLSNEHLGSFVNADDRIGPKNEYQRTRDFIGKSLDPGSAVYDPVARSRQAEAVDTFDRWVQDNKIPSNDPKIRERGTEILNQYKFINLSDTILALPTPRSGAIRRAPNDPAGVQQDMFRAAQEAQRKRASGAYNQREYDDEMAILNRWRKAIERGNK
jgi:hypothetical protein